MGKKFENGRCNLTKNPNTVKFKFMLKKTQKPLPKKPRKARKPRKSLETLAFLAFPCFFDAGKPGKGRKVWKNKNKKYVRTKIQAFLESWKFRIDYYSSSKPSLGVLSFHVKPRYVLS